MKLLGLLFCVCIGLSSITAVADERDDAMDARDVALGLKKPSEVNARKLEKETQEVLVEKVLACDPVFSKTHQFLYRIRDESLTVVIERALNEILKFNACTRQEISEEAFMAFLNQYVIFYMSETTAPGTNYPFTLSEAIHKFESGGYSPSFVDVRGAFEKDKQAKKDRDIQKKEEQKRAIELVEQKEQLRIRQSKLKSGEIIASNFDDSMFLHAPKQLEEIMVSPLLRPDNSIYGQPIGQYDQKLIVDGDEGENILRVKIICILCGRRGEPRYAIVRLTKKTLDYSQAALRIGSSIKLIGRYVQNTKYKTIGGEEKSMPVLDAMYLGR